MTRESSLKNQAEAHFKFFYELMEELNREFYVPDTRWEIDEETFSVRRVKLPEMEWEQFEEANDELE